MPGLRQAWPEGAFYGFDDIYGATRLDYRGPEFGWFAIPDQFSLAKFDALEAAPAVARAAVRRSSRRSARTSRSSRRRPISPTGRRMFDAHPYDGPSIVRAYAQQPDWTHFGPGYVQAVAYDYATLAGYLRRARDRDFVMILIGDHQPPAAVSGEGAPWDVPVHVIASRPSMLDALRAHGFRTASRPAARRSARCTRCCRSCSTRSARVKKKPRRSQRSQENMFLCDLCGLCGFSYRPAAARPIVIASSAVGPCISSARNPSFTRWATSCGFAVSMSASFGALCFGEHLLRARFRAGAIASQCLRQAADAAGEDAVALQIRDLLRLSDRGRIFEHEHRDRATGRIRRRPDVRLRVLKKADRQLRLVDARDVRDRDAVRAEIEDLLHARFCDRRAVLVDRRECGRSAPCG